MPIRFESALLSGFQIKCSILFGEPQAGKACLLLTKSTVLASARAGAIPIPDKYWQLSVRFAMLRCAGFENITEGRE
jgi:hypothetical protein